MAGVSSSSSSSSSTVSAPRTMCSLPRQYGTQQRCSVSHRDTARLATRTPCLHSATVRLRGAPGLSGSQSSDSCARISNQSSAATPIVLETWMPKFWKPASRASVAATNPSEEPVSAARCSSLARLMTLSRRSNLLEQQRAQTECALPDVHRIQAQQGGAVQAAATHRRWTLPPSGRAWRSRPRPA